MESKVQKLYATLMPVLIYFVIMNLVMGLGSSLISREDSGYMILQSCASIITIPVIWRIYAGDRALYPMQAGEIKADLKTFVLIILAAVFLSMALNNIIYLTGVTQSSASYQEVNRKFFGSGLMWEIIGTCILAPVLEEVLYRGVVYGRVRYWFSKKEAAFISAFIFSAMHMNLVQFIYAFLLGILLVTVYEYTGKIYAPIIAHAAANLIAVLRIELGFLKAFEKNAASIGACAVVFMAVGAGSLYLFLKQKK